MSSLSQAGRSTINNQVNRAFTKGLYGVDPSQLQRKQMQRRQYQQQLKRQAQQQQRRKAAEKAKQKQQDQKLQRKIQLDILKEKQQKQKTNKQQKNKSNQNATQNYQNLTNSRTQNSPAINKKKNYFGTSQGNTMVKNTISSPQINLYKQPNFTEQGYLPLNSQPSQQLFPYNPRSIYNMQQDKYYQQQMQNRVRRFKQTLDRKIQQVYKQIESSKKNQINDNIIDDIKRRLRSNSYLGHDASQLQKSNIKQFQDQYSQFYKIPKRSNQFSSLNKTNPLKNLDYDSQSRYKSSLRNYDLESRNIPQQNSRMYTQRQDKSEYNDQTRKWGNKRNNNYLGNRQALDYKIQSTLTNIDNIIQTHNRQGNNM